ncbi:MAG: UDP-N-acetylmuramoyl-tripeptide--D-alanyl-D-alanine ligase [Polyangiaceae bacterium]
MASAIPDNRAHFSLGEILEATSGTASGSFDSVDGVVTDTRASLEGKLFVALPGERYDGHAFVGAALRGGARALLVERDVGDVKAPVIRVESTYRALGQLARAHRRRWGGKLVAVAGSAGKTTTKACIGAVLEAALPGAVHQVAGNLNNRVGVPFVLFGLSSQHRLAVIEIGTNAPGEVAELTAIAEPDVGVLTLIGLEHTEGLGSIDSIEVEESALFDGLSSAACAIGNGDDPRVRRNLERASSARKLTFGFDEPVDYRVLDRKLSSNGGSKVVIRRPHGPPLELEVSLIGRAGAYAVAAAAAAAEACTGEALSAATFSRGLERLGAGEPGRLNLIRVENGPVVLDDTYNANPASLVSSVAAAAEIARAEGRRLLLVLGEMRELGDDSPRLHREAGEQLLGVEAELVLGVAGDARWLVEPLARAGLPAEFVEDVDAGLQLLATRLTGEDVVLVKASRGVRAERIVEGLKQSFRRSP